MTDNHSLSGDKTPERRLKTRKRRKKAAYRKMKKYYKSIKQYQKERLRRKLCWLLSGTYKETEIAEMLGISVRTVIRDMNKIKPYYFRLSRSYFNKLEQERIKEMNLKLQGKSLFERIRLLTDAMIEQHERFKVREYRRHFQIILVDMTDLGPYGLPKVKFIPGGKGKKTLAFPYKIRLHFKAKYEDKLFLVDVGGIELTQTSGGWGW